MKSYLIKRVGQAVVSLWMVITLTFVLIRQMPGGPVDFLAAQLAENSGGGDESLNRGEVVEILEKNLNINPNKPLHEQYADYMFAMLKGDLGESIWYGDPVIDLLAEAIPWTMFVMSLAILATFLSGIIIGGFMAYWEGGRFDVSMTLANILTSTVPYYVVALLLVGTFGYKWGVFPTGGQKDPNTTPGFNIPFMIGAVKYAALPFLSMLIAGFGGPALAMRGNAIQVLESNYIRVANLRGLQSSRIATRYVTRNAVLPLYTRFMVGISAFFGGSVILEKIFAYPGVGYVLVRAVQARDYPLMMGCFILLAAITIIGALIADLTYGLIDPRIKTGDRNESF